MNDTLTVPLDPEINPEIFNCKTSVEDFVPLECSNPMYRPYGGFACIQCPEKCSKRSIEDCIAVIPARIGSKRIPEKNIRNFLGKPVIAYSIETAKASNIFSKVYVSTDSEKIARIARAYGAEVIMRGYDLSNDTVGLVKVMHHAVESTGFEGIATLIYPVAPLLDVGHLLSGINEFVCSKEIDYAFSAYKIDNRCLRGFLIDPFPKTILGDTYVMTRSQDLPKVYCDAAMFAFGRTSAWLRDTPIFPNRRSRAILIDKKYVVDVDTEKDWDKMAMQYAVLHGTDDSLEMKK